MVDGATIELKVIGLRVHPLDHLLAIHIFMMGMVIKE